MDADVPLPAANELREHRARCSICRTSPFRCDVGQYLRKWVAIVEARRFEGVFVPLDVS